MPLAQLVEHQTFNLGVEGSNPLGHILLLLITSSLILSGARSASLARAIGNAYKKIFYFF